MSITVERNKFSQRALAESRIKELRGQVADALDSAEDAAVGLLAPTTQCAG